jgi:hypothetical protein
MSLRIRRGTEQERIGRTFDQGEIIWTTNGEKLYVGDGVTPGGKNIAAQLAGTNLAFNATTGTLGVTGLTTDLVTEGLNNKYFSAEAAQDAIGAAIAAGSQSGISVVYNDNGAGPASINFTVTGGGGGGLSDIVLDTSPSLGGNLDLNGNNLFGTGSIDIEGNFEVTGAITGDTLIINNGLGSELILNGNDISGTGDVRIAGNFNGTNVSVTGTISATNGLGANLNLNSRDITGFGGINIVGDIGATNFIGDFKGSVFSDTSTLLVDSSTGTLSNGTINLSENSITVTDNTAINIGNATTRNRLEIYGYNTDPGLTVNGEVAGAAGIEQQGAFIRIKSNKGTFSNQTVLATGDLLGQVQFAGYINGGAGGLQTADLVVVRAVVSDPGDLVSNFASGKLQFFIGDQDNPANSKIAEFNDVGVFSAPVLQPGVYANTTARDAAIPSPSAGMMIFLTAGTKFQGYTGSAWVDLN